MTDAVDKKETITTPPEVEEQISAHEVVEAGSSGGVVAQDDPPGPCADDQPGAAAGEGQRKLRLAVAGCAHGEMDKIYEVLAEIEKDKGYKFDMLICCGDYQAVRNYGDLHHMHVNEKYRSLQTFYKYYSGEKTAPILTVFVGGNHEASGYLAELPNGGWVAPNIYYMGFANVIRFAGLRIAGLSGIFNGKEFNRGHYERPPYKEHGDVVSSYHVRNLDVWRLKQLRPADDDTTSNPIDIMISHDWPAGIVDFGDKERLLKIKPFFSDDISSGKLGNPSTMQLLYDIRPRYWFAAHLHVAFAALVPHEGKDGAPGAEPTRFLALDKPIPRRQFIQAVELDIPEEAEMKLSYDQQWLAILRNTDSFTSTSRSNAYLPSAHVSDTERWDFRPTEEELSAISNLGDLSIPDNFQQTATPLKEDTPEARRAQSSPYFRNPQTAEFCSWLGISDLNKMLADKDPDTVAIAHYLLKSSGDDSEIAIDDDIFGDGEDFVLDTRPTSDVLDDFVPPKLTPKTPKEVLPDPLDDFLPPRLTPKTPKGAAEDVLADFTPPKITPKSRHDDSSDDSFVLKRRKVDIPDDD
ncbi:lariat debranching enzyme domain protein [Oesophagostomum dentatum]|uniref:Lariat debranching enzyme domain protein n=1 Tax=Oesophagostomum dentatum TaxID=61180 RepID=A0A0B1T1N3_OESDE|nr:lariat debranching enzyme domain protein [Oesophagostomum dentatum]